MSEFEFLRPCADAMINQIRKKNVLAGYWLLRQGPATGWATISGKTKNEYPPGWNQSLVSKRKKEESSQKISAVGANKNTHRGVQIGEIQRMIAILYEQEHVPNDSKFSAKWHCVSTN